MKQRGLSRRERQIMDSLFKRGEATVAEILEDLPNPPTDSAMRAHLRILESKKMVVRKTEDRRNVYSPSASRSQAGISELRHLMAVFFDGSKENVVRALISERDVKRSDEELDNLIAIIQSARTKKRK